MKQLYPVQLQHKQVLLSALVNHRAALDKSVTGAGKTLIACDIAKDLGLPAFAVVPKVSIPAWTRELDDRGVDYYDVINYEKLRTGKTPYGKWLDGRNRIWKWNLPERTLVIFDECQRGKGMNSQNARMMWGAKPYSTLCLSATAAKDPTEMKALGYLLGLHNLRDFWKWAKANGCKPGIFGGLQFEGTAENLDKIHHQIFPEHGSGLTYKDLAEFFTETEINTTPLDFGDEIKQLYKEMGDELLELSKRASSDSSVEELTIRLRARQKAELLKVPYMVERTYDFLDEGRSVVLFVNYTQTLLALKERISNVCDVGVIAGIDTKNRQKYIDDFAQDKLRVIVANSKAGGVSVNLQDVRGQYPRVSILSPDDDEKAILQALGRIHRLAGKTPTQQYVLFAAGTIEEEVEANCRQKMINIGIVNEGIDNQNGS
jgi:superfamily II DNA or RNA helicase